MKKFVLKVALCAVAVLGVSEFAFAQLEKNHVIQFFAHRGSRFEYPDNENTMYAFRESYKAGARGYETDVRLTKDGDLILSHDESLYRNAPQWRIPIELHRRIPGLPIFCDPSHMGGRRELIAPLSQEAMDLGFDGLMIEAHCNPDCAWSDKNQQITPEVLSVIVERLVIRDTMQTTENLTDLRREIDKLDDELLCLLAKRMRVCHEIGLYKKEHNMPVLQARRYDEILNKRGAQAVELGLNPEFVKTVLRAVHEESVRAQMKLFNNTQL